MTDHPADFRPTGSWDDLDGPARADDGPRGLGDDPPRAPLDPDEVFLCVTCWHWHSEGACSGLRPRRRLAG